jgi:uncharacterized protein (TIGR02246 family)
MRTGTPARSVIATMALAAALTMAACGSGVDTPEPSSAPTSHLATRNNPPTASDEAAVRLLLEQINEAWERGDATAYASFHTPDTDLIDFRGTHVVGRQAITDLLQPLFDGVLSGTRVEAEIVDLRFLTDEVAIFHTEGRVAPTGDDSVQTFVATKGAEGWLIAAFQNTRTQAPPVD